MPHDAEMCPSCASAKVERGMMRVAGHEGQTETDIRRKFGGVLNKFGLLPLVTFSSLLF